MVAIDTNIVLRLVLRDDPKQLAIALSLLESEAFISDSVILETGWVLWQSYKLPADIVANALEAVFGLPTVLLAEPQRLALVLKLFRAGLDWGDAFHLASTPNGLTLKTFDQKFYKKARALGHSNISLP